VTTTPPHLHTRGFQSLITHAHWRELVGEGHRADMRGGGRLLDQGDRSAVVHALVRGRVRVTHAEPDGKEALIAVRGPGDLLGEYAQRDRGAHMASVWTLEDCTVATLGADAFERFIRRHRLDEALQRYILAKIRQVGERIWRASNLQTEQRMAQLFLEAVNAAPGSTPTVPMSQGLIADSLGVTRRKVNALLAQWKEHGLVRTRPAPIAVLDLAALARRAHLR
jgi:CRP/FNR family transcriptional regulator, cyclic AMP receptor protein